MHRDLFRRGLHIRSDTVFLLVTLLVTALFYAWMLNLWRSGRRVARAA
ncbi:hypothetical protein JY651_45925 [Pyxidicoccus parkwayensis]|uniref:Uncharacterized protein n=1 Tax=Pyxidicoccus parkwayensis TaxID=2813578 RepID=A0ABX7NUK4_9BACT|nr:hypothetical protein [Pyxidicoccus parkwaysis]QSQ22383.1 hypothetical protein JY651_45925 [Pyxidicoccus parkwaysis]